MKLWGQVELRAILVPVITSAITGAGSYTIAKGQAASAYEQRQADQQVVLDRLVAHDLARQVEVVQLRKDVEGSVQRIEAGFTALQQVIITRMGRR